jgi:hypothetical protein
MEDIDRDFIDRVNALSQQVARARAPIGRLKLPSYSQGQALLVAFPTIAI